MKTKKLFVEENTTTERNLIELTEKEFNDLVKSNKVKGVFDFITDSHDFYAGEDVGQIREIVEKKMLERLINKYPNANAYLKSEESFEYFNSEPIIGSSRRKFLSYHLLPLKIKT